MNTTKPPITSLHIAGKRWFNPRSGTTYCRAEIFINGEHAGTTSQDSGYGDYFLITAFEWMFLHGWFPNYEEYSRRSATLVLREVLKGTYSVADVGKERDL